MPRKTKEEKAYEETMRLKYPPRTFDTEEEAYTYSNMARTKGLDYTVARNAGKYQVIRQPKVDRKRGIIYYDEEGNEEKY